MFKFTFSVIFVGAICQAFVTSIPADSDPSLSDSFKVVGKAAMDVLQSAGELASSLTASVQSRAKSEMNKLVMVYNLRMELMTLAAGKVKEFSVKKSPEELRQYQVVATSVEDVFSKLDNMELANELIRRTTREVLDNQTTTIFSPVICLPLLYAALDRNFQAEKGLQDVYKKIREKNEKEIPLSNLKELRTDSSMKKNMSKRSLNFFFSWFIYNRLSTPRAFFIVARSVVELAKKPEKFDQVQRIYEETLVEQSERLDLDSPTAPADAPRVVASLLVKLKEKLENNTSLKEDFQAMQKNVSERSDWDGSIWDLRV